MSTYITFMAWHGGSGSFCEEADPCCRRSSVVLLALAGVCDEVGEEKKRSQLCRCSGGLQYPTDVVLDNIRQNAKRAIPSTLAKQYHVEGYPVIHAHNKLYMVRYLGHNDLCAASGPS